MANSGCKSLESLGHDILVSEVFPCLDSKDLLNVAMASKELYRVASDPYVWHSQYRQRFGNDYNLPSGANWHGLFESRSKASLFAWGEARDGRLGTQWGVSALYEPHLVESLKHESIVDVAAGGFTVVVLDTKGDLYGIGDLNYRPRRRAGEDPRFRMINAAIGNLGRPRVSGGPRARGRFPVPHMSLLPPGYGSRIQPVSQPELHGQQGEEAPDEESIKDGIARELLKPPFNNEERCAAKKLHTTAENNTFVTVTSGRKHVMAMDTEYRVWQWDETFGYEGVELKFDFDQRKIMKLVGGWNMSGAIVQGLGLITWYQTDGVQMSENSAAVDVHYALVPTEEPAVDLFCGQGFIVYITQSGAIYRDVQVGSLEEAKSQSYERLQEFENVLKESSEKGTFKRLTGTYLNFAAITDTDEVFVGHLNSDSPLLLKELQHVGCTSVAAGDHHFLALCNGGQVFSWGTESRGCGTFGLGRDPDSFNAEVARNGDVILKTPTRVQLPGKAFAISASGMQSYAIVVGEQG